jgi:hypothetical protein
MQKKINHLLCVPNEKNSGINKSFRDIARELKKFKKILMINPVTKDFLKSPYSKTREEIEYLDRVWTVLANKLINDTSNLPTGYGKRLLFCTNGGKVFIDNSTFVSGNPKWLNYSIIFGDLLLNIEKEKRLPNVASLVLPQENITFNPQESKLDNLNDTNLVKQSICVRAGSIEPPTLNIANLNPEKTKPVTFQLVENHLTRKEIIGATSKVYDWSSRYSDTVFTPNWYVATQLLGKDGYVVYVRLSYFKL